jgi:hypothetical protein
MPIGQWCERSDPGEQIKADLSVAEQMKLEPCSFWGPKKRLFQLMA